MTIREKTKTGLVPFPDITFPWEEYVSGRGLMRERQKVVSLADGKGGVVITQRQRHAEILGRTIWLGAGEEKATVYQGRLHTLANGTKIFGI